MAATGYSLADELELELLGTLDPAGRVPEYVRALASNADADADDEELVLDADGTLRHARSLDLSSVETAHAKIERELFETRDPEKSREVLGRVHSHNQLVAIIDETNKLAAALERGDDVASRIGELYRAAKGLQSETEERRRVIDAIAAVAKRSEEQWGEILKRPVTDKDLCTLACAQLAASARVDIVDRLRKNPLAVAKAVKLWRRGAGAGRPRKGELSGSKWAAIADVLRIARLGRLDEKAVEKLVERRPAK